MQGWGEKEEGRGLKYIRGTRQADSEEYQIFRQKKTNLTTGFKKGSGTALSCSWLVGFSFWLTLSKDCHGAEH